jgi:hypothetical protein
MTVLGIFEEVLQTDPVVGEAAVVASADQPDGDRGKAQRLSIERNAGASRWP